MDGELNANMRKNLEISRNANTVLSVGDSLTSEYVSSKTEDILIVSIFDVIMSWKTVLTKYVYK